MSKMKQIQLLRVYLENLEQVSLIYKSIIIFLICLLCLFLISEQVSFDNESDI